MARNRNHAIGRRGVQGRAGGSAENPLGAGVGPLVLSGHRSW
jgi:hypothetical protein